MFRALLDLVKNRDDFELVWREFSRFQHVELLTTVIEKQWTFALPIVNAKEMHHEELYRLSLTANCSCVWMKSLLKTAPMSQPVLFQRIFLPLATSSCEKVSNETLAEFATLAFNGSNLFSSFLFFVDESILQVLCKYWSNQLHHAQTFQSLVQRMNPITLEMIHLLASHVPSLHFETTPIVLCKALEQQNLHLVDCIVSSISKELIGQHSASLLKVVFQFRFAKSETLQSMLRWFQSVFQSEQIHKSFSSQHGSLFVSLFDSTPHLDAGNHSTIQFNIKCCVELFLEFFPCVQLYPEWMEQALALSLQFNTFFSIPFASQPDSIRRQALKQFVSKNKWCVVKRVSVINRVLRSFHAPLLKPDLRELQDDVHCWEYTIVLRRFMASQVRLLSRERSSRAKVLVKM